MQSVPFSLPFQHNWSLRDLLSVNTANSSQIVVSHQTGVPLCQNSASMAMIGGCEQVWDVRTLVTF